MLGNVAAGATTTTARPRLSLNKRVAYPQTNVSHPTASTVKTTAEGLPLPFSTAKYQPGMFPPNPAPIETVASSLPPPPPPPPSAPIPVSAATPSNVTMTTQAIDAQPVDLCEALDFCRKTFDRTFDALATQLSADKVNGIRKRIDAMHSMWTEHKLKDAAKRDSFAIARGIVIDYPIVARLSLVAF